MTWRSDLAALAMQPLHTPYTHPAPYTLHTLHPTPYTLHPTPYTVQPTPCTTYTPNTQHPTPYTLHPTPYTHHTPAAALVTQPLLELSTARPASPFAFLACEFVCVFACEFVCVFAWSSCHCARFRECARAHRCARERGCL